MQLPENRAAAVIEVLNFMVAW